MQSEEWSKPFLSFCVFGTSKSPNAYTAPIAAPISRLPPTFSRKRVRNASSKPQRTTTEQCLHLCKASTARIRSNVTVFFRLGSFESMPMNSPPRFLECEKLFRLLFFCFGFRHPGTYITVTECAVTCSFCAWSTHIAISGRF